MNEEEIYKRGFNDGESRMWYIRYNEISGIIKQIGGVIGEDQLKELLVGLYDDEEIDILLNWEEGEE
jgi:hypothetical protein